MTKLYKKKRGHGVTPCGPSDMAGFFDWAHRLCTKGGVREIRLETPEFAVTWKLPQRPDHGDDGGGDCKDDKRSP